MNKEHLLQIAHQWAEDTISDWFNEYGGWDHLLEDDEITEEELAWIQENVKFDISASFTEE